MKFHTVFAFSLLLFLSFADYGTSCDYGRTLSCCGTHVNFIINSYKTNNLYITINPTKRARDICCHMKHVERCLLVETDCRPFYNTFVYNLYHNLQRHDVDCDYYKQHYCPGLQLTRPKVNVNFLGSGPKPQRPLIKYPEEATIVVNAITDTVKTALENATQEEQPTTIYADTVTEPGLVYDRFETTPIPELSYGEESLTDCEEDDGTTPMPEIFDSITAIDQPTEGSVEIPVIPRPNKCKKSRVPVNVDSIPASKPAVIPKPLPKPQRPSKPDCVNEADKPKMEKPTKASEKVIEAPDTSMEKVPEVAGKGGCGNKKGEEKVVSSERNVVSPTEEIPASNEENPSEPESRPSPQIESGEENPTEKTPVNVESGEENPTNPTNTESGEENPTEKTPANIESGEENPTTPTNTESGEESPTKAPENTESGEQGPTKTESGEEAPPKAGSSDQNPTNNESGEQNPANNESGEQTPAKGTSGEQGRTTADQTSAEENPEVVNSGENTLKPATESGEETPSTSCSKAKTETSSGEEGGENGEPSQTGPKVSSKACKDAKPKKLSGKMETKPVDSEEEIAPKTTPKPIEKYISPEDKQRACCLGTYLSPCTAMNSKCYQLYLALHSFLAKYDCLTCVDLEVVHDGCQQRPVTTTTPKPKVDSSEEVEALLRVPVLVPVPRLSMNPIKLPSGKPASRNRYSKRKPVKKPDSSEENEKDD